MKWITGVVLALGFLTSACTEHFTTVGSCPTLCPGGQSSFRDTTLLPIANGDSSFTGYVEPSELVSVLAANGGSYGQRRAVIRFLPRGDSVTISDTARAFTVDSVGIELGLMDRDTTVSNFVLEIYRLPLSIDTNSTFAEVDAAMTPANKLTEVPEPVTFRTGVFHVTFAADSLARVAFAAADSGVLQIGLRVRADGPTGARYGTPNSGADAPLFTSYVKAIGVSDSLAPQSVARIAQRYFTVSPPAAPISNTLLAVGGVPVSRTFLRFQLPPFLRDSATIIRATLTLHADVPVFGIPADTATVNASAILADFGSKSPAVTGAFGSAFLLPGDTVSVIEVAQIVQLWQGLNALPAIIRVNLGQEGASFIFPLYHSTRSVSGPPTLRITYRAPFAFEGY